MGTFERKLCIFSSPWLYFQLALTIRITTKINVNHWLLIFVENKHVDISPEVIEGNSHKVLRWVVVPGPNKLTLSPIGVVSNGGNSVIAVHHVSLEDGEVGSQLLHRVKYNVST